MKGVFVCFRTEKMVQTIADALRAIPCKAVQKVPDRVIAVLMGGKIGGIYDFFLKVVVKDLAAYDQFVFNKLTKVNGIVKMQSSFVLNEIKHTTALKVVPGE